MRKILILDENEAILTLYRIELTDEGYEVMVTDDYEGFVDLVRNIKPNLIVMDTRFRKVSDVNTLQNIRKIYNNIPVILNSAVPMCEFDMDVVDTDYFIIKSSDLSNLKLTIRKAITGGIQHNKLLNEQI